MKPGWQIKLFFFLALAATLFPNTVLGHTTGLSTSDLAFGTNGLKAETIMAASDFRLALVSLEKTNLHQNGDARLSEAELAGRMEAVRKFAQDCLIVEFDGRAAKPTVPKLTLDDQDNFHIELNYPGTRPTRLRVQATLFKQLPANHSHFVSVHDSGGQGLGNKMMKAGDDVLEITCPTGEAKAEHRVSTFGDFLKLGIEHIWTGYDHLLFLLALLVVCKDFKSAVQVVTFFTVAHSITLALATLNLVSVSSRVVEPVIAASIIYVGVENLIQRDGPKGRWLITFLFGLIHGFGFASVLRDLGVAAGGTGIAMPLVSFNLGVEVGQIVIAGILLPIIWQLRKWQPFTRWGVPVVSVIVAAMGAVWLVQRVWFT